ncbi:Probable dimethyladenosine transferase [Seminavis robusta]|uniref:rRNA adenine N(6)-methyltransferase n=1 Tax=Seminavis robusta TaxID=568900 RepID=A0A9N8EZ79_9STRA|nr:Probable dimethyladenosine transferase [Seminavis robusta]|eukprot:Sro2218_g319550.1 Probable dimethyladenosine transferase (343) ;mRNA; r:11352-12458
MPKTSRKRRSGADHGPSTMSAGGGATTRSGNPSSNSGPKHNNLITPNTSLGQHFLKNPAVIQSIIQKSSVKSTDICLEIGPGTGNMTIPLLEKSKQVVALEYDHRMVRELNKRVEGTPLRNKLHIIQGDALHTQWPKFDVCVANVPYQISSALVFKLLQHYHFRCAVLMFQEEFALRLTARPGEALYCRLSVNTQLLAKADQLLKVGRNNFRPPPKVESRVVRIQCKQPPPPVNFVEWDGMIRLLFNRKNKTLRSVLMTKSTLQLLESNRKTHQALAVQKKQDSMEEENNDDENDNSKKTIKEILEEILEQEAWKGRRASKMDQDEFLQLLSEFNDAGIHFC